MSTTAVDRQTSVRLKATDFDLSREIRFAPEKGLTTFRDSRLLIFDANAIGLLRQNLIDSLGRERAREFFLRFGYQNGLADFKQMKSNYTFQNEMELLASGPVIHTFEGIVRAIPSEIRFDRDTGEFYFTGVWANSYEAEQHLRYQAGDGQPVCWTLMGYASGWCTGFFGLPLLAIEPKCVGKGDDHCAWLIKPLADWGDEALPYVVALHEFWEEGAT